MGGALHGKWKVQMALHAQSPSVKRQSTQGSVQGRDQVCSLQLHADQRVHGRIASRWHGSFWPFPCRTWQLLFGATLCHSDWQHCTEGRTYCKICKEAMFDSTTIAAQQADTSVVLALAAGRRDCISGKRVSDIRSPIKGTQQQSS